MHEERDIDIMLDAIRVLYVDDEPYLLSIGKIFLEKSGDFFVETVGSADAALKLLKEKNYDVIISDYQMPEMDGITFLKQLKRTGNNTPFIIFTGRGREEVVIEALNEGADFYLQKGGEPKSQFAELANKIRYAAFRRKAELDLRESEERYRHVVEDQTEIICRFLPDGTHVFVNEAYCRYFGLDRNTIIGSKFKPKISHEDNQKISRLIASLVQNDPYKIIEHKVIMPDGSIRWLRWVDRAIFFADGQLKEYQSVGRDITKQKQIEEGLLAEHKMIISLASAVSLIDVLPLCVETAIRLSGMDSGGIYLLNRNTGDFILTSSSGLSDEFIKEVSCINADSESAHIVLSGRSVYSQYLMLGISIAGARIKENLHAIAIIPILSQNRVIACFNIASHTRNIITDESRKTLEAIAALIGNGIGRFTAEEELQKSEEKYRTIFENAGDAIAIHNFEGNLVEVNDVICRRLGYTREELLKMKAGDVDEPVHARKVEERIQELNKNGHLIFETVHITRDGRRISTEVNSIVFHLGDKPFVMSIARDITKRKQAEEALRDSEKKYYNLFHNSALGIFHSTFDGKFIDVNPALANIFGYNSPEDMIISITNIAKQIYYDPLEYDDVATAVLNKGGFIDSENRYRRRDDTLLHGKLHLRIVSDQQGKPSHYEGFVEDITKRKLSEEELSKSEEKYRTVADFTYDWEFWITPDGSYNYVSPSCERITGYRPEEFIRDPDLLTKITHNDDRDKIVCHLSSKESQNIEHSALEYRIITKNGEERWISHVCQPIYNTNGEYLGNRGSNRDITERKRAEEVLRESEGKLNAMLESIADNMSMMDKDLNIIWANETAKKYFGKDLVGRKCYEVYHQRQSPCEPYPCITLKAFQDGEIHRHETRVTDIQGQTKFFECSANVALNNENGNPITVLEISRDITERRQMEESLRQANKKLSILSGITRHDITNKLAVINGYLDILEDEQSNLENDEYLSKISTTVQRISAMIQFTKEYEQIGVYAPSWQECYKLVDTAAKQILLGQVVVENDLPSGIEVFADLLIGKVFYNMIDNAVRHGGKITTIRFSIQESRDSHQIICEDDGEGVPAEDKEEIFERGFGKNSGLGLTLVREILAITGMTIQETGEPGEGARFEIKVTKGKWRYGSEGS